MQTYLLSKLHAVSAIGQSAVPKVPSVVTLHRRREKARLTSRTDEPTALKRLLERRSTSLIAEIVLPVLIVQGPGEW